MPEYRVRSRFTYRIPVAAGGGVVLLSSETTREAQPGEVISPEHPADVARGLRSGALQEVDGGRGEARQRGRAELADALAEIGRTRPPEPGFFAGRLL